MPSKLQVLEHKHITRRRTITIFLDLEAAFDPVGFEVLCNCFLLKGIVERFTSVSNLCMRTAKIESVIGVIFHPSLPREVMFVRLANFHPLCSTL